jgi:hypothetical protein
VRELRRFLGMRGSRVTDVHCRIDLRNEGIGMEEVFPESKIGISLKLAPFQPKTHMGVYSFFPKKVNLSKRKTPRTYMTNFV